MDKGYNNYKQFVRFTEKGIFFITRQKDNVVYQSISEKKIGAGMPTSLLKEETIQQTYKDDKGKEQILELRRIACRLRRSWIH